MNLLLRICAGFIDLLQFIFFLVFLAFQVITPYGGAAVGGLTGAYICWNMSSGIVSGIMAGAACAFGGGAVGGAISALAVPIGMVIDVAISATFGTLLLLLLWVTGRFYFMPVALGFAGELLPGVNAFVPGWSLLVHRCIQQHNQEKQGVHTGGVFGVVGTVVSMVPGGRVANMALKPALAGAAAMSGAASESPRTGRTPLQTKNFDGIRAANDNTPRTTYAKAA